MYANDPEGFKAKQDQAKQMYKQGIDPMSQFTPQVQQPESNKTNMKSTQFEDDIDDTPIVSTQQPMMQAQQPQGQNPFAAMMGGGGGMPNMNDPAF